MAVDLILGDSDTSEDPAGYNHEVVEDSLTRVPAACPDDGPSRRPTTTEGWDLGGSSRPTGARSSGRGYSLF